MHDGTRRLYEDYLALVDRAAAVNLVPATGLTPREQRDRLRGVRVLPRADVEHLVSLLERCVYADRPRPEDVDEGLALCARLGAALPARPDVTRRPRRGPLGWLATNLPRVMRWLEKFGPAVVLFVLLAGAAIAVTWDAGRGGGFGGGGGGSGGASGGGSGGGGGGHAITWRDSYQAERAAVASHGGGWATPLSRGTRTAMPPPASIKASDPLPWFDGVTGRDADAPAGADPFSPRLAWTHRLRVYPIVDHAYGFRRDPRVVGTAEAEDAVGQRFTVRVRVELRRGVPIPVPSPAPEAIVVDARAVPHATIRFVRDGADGLCVVSDRTQSARLTYVVASPAGYRSAPLPATPFTPVEISLPPNVRADAERVAAVIGELPAPTYAATVRRLHAYFAGFSVCPLEPADRRENSFLTVALARKGVCRHRARAFVPVAQALGVPARLVENRCHSFAEVQLPDGRWRRLEFRLGTLPTSTMLDAPIAHDDRPAGTGATFIGSSPLPLLLGYLVAIGAGVLLLASHYRDVRAHVVGHASRPSRAERRSRRDRRRAVHTAPEQLAAQVRARLARHVGEDDPAALPRAIAASDLPPSIKRRALEVLGEGPRLASDGSDLQATFWTCASVLRWLDGRQRDE